MGRTEGVEWKAFRNFLKPVLILRGAPFLNTNDTGLAKRENFSANVTSSLLQRKDAVTFVTKDTKVTKQEKIMNGFEVIQMQRTVT